MANKIIDFKGGMKKAPQKLMGAGLRIGGTVGTLYGAKKASAVNPKTGKPYVAPKVLAFGALAIGLAAEMFVKQEQLQNIAEGVTTAGGLLVMKEFMPDMGAKVGISGLGATTTTTRQDNAPLPASVANLDFEALAREAEELGDRPTEVLNGYGDAPHSEEVEEEMNTSEIQGIGDIVSAVL